VALRENIMSWFDSLFSDSVDPEPGNYGPKEGLLNMPDTTYLTNENNVFPQMQVVPGLYMDEREEELKSALERSASIWNVKPSAFALGEDRNPARNTITPTYNFRSLPERTGAKTGFGLGVNDRPSIILNDKTPIDPNYFEHEGVHRLSPHFRSLMSDGGVRDWDISTNKGVTGYQIGNDGGWLKYKPQYVAHPDYNDRVNFFTNQFANDPMNQQRPELKKYMGGAMGRILADDLLNFDSMAGGAISSREPYSMDPEEILARAITTYGAMKDLDPAVRFNDDGKIYNKYIGANEEQAKKYGVPVGTQLTYPSVNKGIGGGARIRPETYEAIKLWMDNNRMNKYGNGFAMGNLRGPLSA
jgi:hypothetical protein